MSENRDGRISRLQLNGVVLALKMMEISKLLKQLLLEHFLAIGSLGFRELFPSFSDIIFQESTEESS